MWCEYSNSELESVVFIEMVFVENFVMFECFEGIVKESFIDVIVINFKLRIMCFGKF